LGSNAVKKTREERLMSRAELARKAGISPQTLHRVERGKTCRLETKRKILFALGIDLADKEKIYQEE
jgi:DNA-binding XRE family transcriptional regulator